jgi:hypothetical protein
VELLELPKFAGEHDMDPTANKAALATTPPVEERPT